MGIHHSSDTKTLHDHDNNCQMCHSTASQPQAQRLEAERRLRRTVARPAGGYDVRPRSAALGRVRYASGHHSPPHRALPAAPTCDSPRFHEQQNQTDFAGWPAQWLLSTRYLLRGNTHVFQYNIYE